MSTRSRCTRTCVRVKFETGVWAGIRDSGLDWTHGLDHGLRFGLDFGLMRSSMATISSHKPIAALFADIHYEVARGPATRRGWQG